MRAAAWLQADGFRETPRHDRPPVPAIRYDRGSRRRARNHRGVLELECEARRAGDVPTTTPSSPAPYAEPGPYAVGFTTQQLADGRRVVVWYPADRDGAESHEQETIDLAGMLTPELQKLI